MRKSGTVQTTAIVEYTCDSCKKTVANEAGSAQEWLHYEDTAGFFAEHWPDMTHKELDLCEKCTFDLLGKYIRTMSYDF